MAEGRAGKGGGGGGGRERERKKKEPKECVVVCVLHLSWFFPPHAHPTEKRDAAKEKGRAIEARERKE